MHKKQRLIENSNKGKTIANELEQIETNSDNIELIEQWDAIETSLADIPSTSSSDLSNRSNEEFLLLSVETNNNLGNEATTERECMTHMGSRWKLLYEKKFDISGNDIMSFLELLMMITTTMLALRMTYRNSPHLRKVIQKRMTWGNMVMTGTSNQ